jgi:hypothetical protein
MGNLRNSNADEIGWPVTRAGLAKAQLSWADLLVKSFLGGESPTVVGSNLLGYSYTGMFITLGSLFDVIVTSGTTGLRESNPSLVTFIAAFTFPICPCHSLER